ncbi:MAG: hypothetical protein K2I00_05130, partial [Ruminococcus sp.]|nr:hypothetical protein [Ruminococcus sp.]
IRKSKKFEKIKKSEKTEKPEKKSLGDKIEFILKIWEVAGKPVLKIFKGFKFSGLYIDFAIGNENAYDCAINYGRICGGVYNILAWLGIMFRVKYKTVDVFPDFDAKESRYDAAVNISFNFMNIIIAAVWFALIYIFKISIPNKKQK